MKHLRDTIYIVIPFVIVAVIFFLFTVPNNKEENITEYFSDYCPFHKLGECKDQIGWEDMRDIKPGTEKKIIADPDYINDVVDPE